MLSLAVFLPIVCGLLLLLLGRSVGHRMRQVLVETVTVVTSLLVLFCLLNRRGTVYTPFYLLPSLPIRFAIDGVGSVFTAIVAFLWPLAALYGFEYMEHEGGENHFFALYTITYGVTLGISTAANILTLYFFYEFLTLSTLPLVMHGTEKPSEHAGYTYMLYSFFGAALAFIGVMLVLTYGDGGAFTMGGVMTQAAAEHPTMVQLGYLCAFLGFGVKAAVFPFHAWLPEASVAPTPVTALLHAVAVVKSGVFAIIRVTYFSFGAQVLRGTMAQNIALLLASVTIVYGSTEGGQGDHPHADGGQGAPLQAPPGVFHRVEPVLHRAGGEPDDAERPDGFAGAHALPRADQDYAVFLRGRGDGEDRAHADRRLARIVQSHAVYLRDVHHRRDFADGHAASAGLCEQVAHRFGGD